MKKRSQPTPTPNITIQHDDKKIRISAPTIKIKTKVKTTPVVIPTKDLADVTLPPRIPVASDTPFVPLAFDPTVAKKLRVNYSMYKDKIDKAKQVAADDKMVRIFQPCDK